MSKVWIVVALVAAAAGAAAGYVLIKSRVPDLAPAGPNRDLAPDSLACYAEVKDGAGVWTKMRGTDAWNDLAASKIAATVTEAEPVKEFLAALDQVASKAGYRIDATNAMKLVGRELSVGVKLDPAGGVPHVLVLTKLDTAALTKDLLEGGTDLDALWAEMQRRTGKLDFKVTASEHRDHKMATATRGEASYHAALLGDTLAVASDAALVRAAIDCRLDGGTKSIGRRAEFQADMKALPAEAPIVEWYDLDALDAGRASLDAGLARFSGDAGVPGAIHAILDGTKGAHSVARATVLPEGDLYRLSWSYSKRDELFADRASPAVAGLLPGEWALYGEFRQVGGVVEAWKRSALRRNLDAGELGKWIDGVMDDPAKTAAGATGLFGNALPSAMETDDEDDTPSESHSLLSMIDAFGDRFSTRMAKHLFEQWLGAMTKGEGAVAFDATAEPSVKFRVAMAVRLDTEGRLLALAMGGALQAGAATRIKEETVGTRRVWSQRGDDEYRAHWTLVGDTFVVGNDAELVRGAARSEGAAAAPAGRIADAIAGLKPGWRAFGAYDMDRLMGVFTAATSSARRSAGTAEVDKLLGVYREAGMYGSSGAVAVYVPDDLASIEVRSRTVLTPASTEGGRALRAESGESCEPRCWASLPDSTIVHGTLPAAGVRTMWVVGTGFASMFGADMDSITSGFREAMGMDLEKELIPALGREVFFAVTFKAAPPGDADPDAPPMVLPGVLVGIEVKDPEVVRKALDRAIGLADESMQDSPNAPAQSPFVREPHEGVEIVRLAIPREQLPVPMEPACALHDGFLLVALEAATLRDCIDVRKGRAPRLVDSPTFAAATGELGRKSASFVLLDWNRLADQVAVYAPMMGPALAADEVPYPDFPEDGDEEEWKRRVDEYQKKMSSGRGAGEAKARRWIDAFRVVEYVGASGTFGSDVTESTLVVRFKK